MATCSTGATLADVSITDSAGRPFLKADSLSRRGTWCEAFSPSASQFDDVVLYRPDVVVEKLPGATSGTTAILWPASKPTGPGDTMPGWGSWVTLHQRHGAQRRRHRALAVGAAHRGDRARARQPRSRTRSPAARDSSSCGRRAATRRSIELEQLNGKFPLVRIADPDFKNRLIEVAAMSMEAFPFRPPAARHPRADGQLRVQRRFALVEGRGRANCQRRRCGRRRLQHQQRRHAARRSPASPARVRRLPAGSTSTSPKTGGGTLGLVRRSGRARRRTTSSATPTSARERAPHWATSA